MNITRSLVVAAVLTLALAAIIHGPRVNAVHVPGVGRVVWQEGSSRRWVVFPEEKCQP